MFKTSDLQVRPVINLADGRQLGMMSDLELDLEAGRITAIIVPGPRSFFGLFGGGSDYVVPWESVVKIGEDVIIVNLESYSST